MAWLHLLSGLRGNAFLATAVPHTVSMMTRPLRSPFATPSGAGLSACAYPVGNCDLRDAAQAAAPSLGMLVLDLLGARHVGRVHAGNESERA